MFHHRRPPGSSRKGPFVCFGPLAEAARFEPSNLFHDTTRWSALKAGRWSDDQKPRHGRRSNWIHLGKGDDFQWGHYNLPVKFPVWSTSIKGIISSDTSYINIQWGRTVRSLFHLPRYMQKIKGQGLDLDIPKNHLWDFGSTGFCIFPGGKNHLQMWDFPAFDHQQVTVRATSSVTGQKPRWLWGRRDVRLNHVQFHCRGELAMAAMVRRLAIVHPY